MLEKITPTGKVDGNLIMAPIGIAKERNVWREINIRARTAEYILTKSEVKIWIFTILLLTVKATTTL